jgi:hypothetical protein
MENIPGFGSFASFLFVWYHKNSTGIAGKRERGWSEKSLKWPYNFKRKS